MMRKMACIFDLDGTLAESIYKEPLFEKEDWDAVRNRIIPDAPIVPVKLVCTAMRDAGFKIVLVTARSERFRPHTSTWLDLHNIQRDILFMRPDGDERTDEEVKEEILWKITNENYGVHPVMVFEDKSEVIDMYRRHGLFVFDVNQKHNIRVLT